MHLKCMKEFTGQIDACIKRLASCYVSPSYPTILCCPREIDTTMASLMVYVKQFYSHDAHFDLDMLSPLLVYWQQKIRYPFAMEYDEMHSLIGKLIFSRKEVARVLAILNPVEEMETRTSIKEKDSMPDETTHFLREGPPKELLICPDTFPEERCCHIKCESLKNVYERYNAALRIAQDCLHDKMNSCKSLRRIFTEIRQDLGPFVVFVFSLDVIWKTEFNRQALCTCTSKGKKDWEETLEDIRVLCSKSAEKLEDLRGQFVDIPPTDGIERTFMKYCESHSLIVKFVKCFLDTLNRSEALFNERLKQSREEEEEEKEREAENQYRRETVDRSFYFAPNLLARTH